MRGWVRVAGIALGGFVVGASAVGIVWLGVGRPPAAAAPSASVSAAVSTETVYNLRRAMFETFQWSKGQPDLGSEPAGRIAPDRLHGVSFPARISAVSTSSLSVTVDVLTGVSVPDLGTTYRNRHAITQTLPLSSAHVPVFLLVDPQQPVPGMVPDASGPAQSPAEGEASLTLDEFMNVVRADKRAYFTRDAVFEVFVSPEGGVYMLAELPQGS
jgi:hypothetical protein